MKRLFEKILIIGVIILSFILIFNSDLLNQNISPYQFEKAIVEEINEEKLEDDTLIDNLYLGYQQITD